MSEYMPEDMPDRMPEDMPEDMSARMPEDMPDRMPEDLPDRMPEDMPEDMPDRMPNRMSEDMSDRMPEDVPVRTCINVMVGITRSKVILVVQLFFWKKRHVGLPRFHLRHSLNSLLGSTNGTIDKNNQQNQDIPSVKVIKSTQCSICLNLRQPLRFHHLIHKNGS